MADRIIIVSGIMNSGTSAAASILHHLGVDFGNFYTLEEIRAIDRCRINDPEKRYQDFEDKDAYKVFAWATSQQGILSIPQLADGFITYFCQRLAICQDIVGFKIPMFGIMGSIDHSALWGLPIEILAVRRPLDEVFDSIERVTNPDRMQEIHIDLSQQVGHLYYGWRLVHQKIKPKLRLDYDTIRYETENAVNQVVTTFHLTPTPSQIETAIQFIQGYKR